MGKIKVEAKGHQQKISVRVVNHRKSGHRVTIGHSMFVHAKDFTKVMKMAGRA